MIRPVSKIRTTAFIHDFQVMKGKCEKTMKNFGQPVSVRHEAGLLIKDDAKKLNAGDTALYAVYQRSENRILKIVQSTDIRGFQVPLPKAA